MDGAPAYEIITDPVAHCVPMTLPKDAFRRFQEELAALDKEIEQRSPKSRKETAKQAAISAMERAKEEFLALKTRHNLTVADVVAFFPEEEGIAYLQSLIAQQAEAKPRRGRKPKSATPQP
ncbi:2-hydroxyacyl-CoA dehydratase [Dyella sp.]|uniref:2-hydroxyacyl-CoA dehydratase n=1 Tax=Dyella sp. TaxID=1869338 RepID=UPI002B48B80A|nr:2-hydroxyacyl-CoA dehydratase [Dyella sp.]HKT30539.1 2-hydroxyacyl-CoA dehydratase [Dyella sp.]